MGGGVWNGAGCALAATLLAAAGPTQAQTEGVLGGITGAFVRGAVARPATSTSSGPGYLGVAVQPAPDGKRRRAVIASVDPNSPAAAAGLQVGDELFTLAQNRRSIFNGKVATIVDQPSLDAWLASEGPDAPQLLMYRRAGTFLQTAIVLGTPPAAAASGGRTDPARAAYKQLCGSASPSLSAATCQGMKRDLDRAAAAAGNAEVTNAYNQLCAAGAEKLSRETCAAMRVEAGRAPAPGPMRSAAAELTSAYDELCQPGAAQVSAETCAALKADAAPKAPLPKPKIAQKGRKK